MKGLRHIPVFCFFSLGVYWKNGRPDTPAPDRWLFENPVPSKFASEIRSVTRENFLRKPVIKIQPTLPGLN